MIIACPECSTRYVVPDASIGVDGRTVRCAKCRHSWFQEGPELALPTDQPVAAPAPVPAPRPAPAAEETVARTETAASDPVETAAAPDTPSEEWDAEPNAPSFRQRLAARKAANADFDYSDYFDGNSAFAHEAPFRPRFRVTRMWTIAAVLFATVSLGLIGAVAWFGLPNWVPFSRPLFAEAQPGLILSFPAAKQDRRVLPNGTAYFGVSGSVANVGDSPRLVPMIMVVLRNDEEQIVDTREFSSPKDELRPGETVKINQALADIPSSAKYAEFGWKPG